MIFDKNTLFIISSLESLLCVIIKLSLSVIGDELPRPFSFFYPLTGEVFDGSLSLEQARWLLDCCCTVCIRVGCRGWVAQPLPGVSRFLGR